jgi:hypothetical protein
MVVMIVYVVSNTPGSGSSMPHTVLQEKQAAVRAMEPQRYTLVLRPAPFVKPVSSDDASTLPIRLAKRGCYVHGLDACFDAPRGKGAILFLAID